MIKSQTCFRPENFAEAIAQAEVRYAKLLFVVGRSGAGKTELLRTVAEYFRIPLVNLGLELSRRLLPLTFRERKLRAAELIADMFDETKRPGLPLTTLRSYSTPIWSLIQSACSKSLSRTRLLVWSWNGKLDDGHVTYGEPGHREYRRMATDRITLITLE